MSQRAAQMKLGDAWMERGLAQMELGRPIDVAASGPDAARRRMDVAARGPDGDRGTHGWRHARSQPGCDAALAEVVANQPTYGERAGITALTFQELIDTRDKIARIDEKLPATLKLVELLQESRAVLDDSLQRLLGVVSKSVDSKRQGAQGPRHRRALRDHARLRRGRGQEGVAGTSMSAD